jgi:hypothetical protein
MVTAIAIASRGRDVGDWGTVGLFTGKASWGELTYHVDAKIGQGRKFPLGAARLCGAEGGNAGGETAREATLTMVATSGERRNPPRNRIAILSPKRKLEGSVSV